MQCFLSIIQYLIYNTIRNENVHVIISYFLRKIEIVISYVSGTYEIIWGKIQ